MKKERWPLQSTCNTRDLGGYAGQEGCTNKRLVRSDYFREFTLADIDWLKKAGIVCSIDLRSGEECRNVRDLLAFENAIDYHHLPLMSDELMAESDEASLNKDGYLFFMGDVYLKILEKQKKELQSVFQTMLKYPKGSILFHCSAGKDRTGVVAALLLMLCGVPDEQVIADYTLTTDLLTPIKPLFYEQAKTQMTAEAFDLLFGAPAGNMQKMIEHIRQGYGCVSSYMTDIGIDPAQQAQLRRMMYQQSSQG